MRDSANPRSRRPRDHVVASGLVDALVLGGCAQHQAPFVEGVARPVKTIVIAGADGAGVRSFSVLGQAAQRADLAFRLPGRVQDLPIKAGDPVQRGDLVARLDPTDYQIVVDLQGVATWSPVPGETVPAAQFTAVRDSLC